MCYNNTARNKTSVPERECGDMAQLVERRVRNAKARGSNPLITTKIPYNSYGIFLYRGFHDFIVSLLCNANPCGLTLRYASKFARFAFTEAFWPLPTNPLISTSWNTS